VLKLKRMVKAWPLGIMYSRPLIGGAVIIPRRLTLS
jgi:hypothetical protein